MPTRIGKMREVRLSLVLLTLIGAQLLTESVHAASATRMVTTIGTGPIQGGNIASGRDQAISHSLISAVDRVVADLLPKDAILHHFQALNQAIYSDPNQFIQDFKVLTESADGKSYRLVVESTVAVDRLRAKLASLGVLPGAMSLPKILLLIAEQNISDPAPRTWWTEAAPAAHGLWEARVVKQLADKGFTIIPHGALTGRLQPGAPLDDSQAREAARALGADVVIVGQANVDLAPNTMGGTVRSFSGRIDARAVLMATGEIIARSSRTSVSADANEQAGSQNALAEAGDLAGADLAQQMASAWLQNASKPQTIEVLVQGTGGNIANLVKFRRTLGEVSGVSGLQMKEMGTDSAVIRLDYQGTTQALADALMLKSFVTFGIDIYQIEPNGLKIRLVSP
jgi:hypothetical protein